MAPSWWPLADIGLRILCVGSVDRLARLGLLKHIVHLDHADRPCMQRSQAMVMVLLSLPAARKDHFQKAVAGRPSVAGSDLGAEIFEDTTSLKNRLPLRNSRAGYNQLQEGDYLELHVVAKTAP